MHFALPMNCVKVVNVDINYPSIGPVEKFEINLVYK